MSDKRYHWLKITQDFFTMPEIQRLLAQRNGAKLVIAYQKLLLLSLEYDGDLSYYNELGTFVDELAIVTGEKKTILSQLLDVLSAMGLYSNCVLLQFHELTGTETDAARRQRKSRQIKKLQRVQPSEEAGKTEENCDNVTNESQKCHSIKEYRVKSKESREKSIENTPLPPSKGAESSARTKESTSEKKGPKPKPKTARDVYLEFAGEDEELRRAFMDFMEMREKIKKPLTERAAQLGLSKLQELGPPGDWVAIVNQSVERCWQTFYGLRSDGPPWEKEKPAQKVLPEYEALYQEHDKWNIFEEVSHDSAH